jgi:hypothetical protein
MDLDVTKPKFFQFNFTLEGIDYTALSGKLEFMYDNVIYAFPAKVYKERVEVEIPPLQSIIKKHILETDTITANLEIIGETFHLPAWNKEMNILRSVFIESDEPYIDDINNLVSETTNTPSQSNDSSGYDNVLKEDIAFLRKLRNEVETKNESSEFQFEKEETVITENTSVKKPIKKKKSSFNKKKFLKEASEQEKNAVANNIPFEETSKNDTPEQKEFRLKIRSIVQEGYIKKLKKSKTKIVKEEAIKHPVDETKETINEQFDVNTVSADNVNKDVIRLMMESVGMKTTKTQNKMIEHAQDKGAKTDIEIFDTIKGMIYPQQTDQIGGMNISENYEQAYKVFSSKK